MIQEYDPRREILRLFHSIPLEQRPDFWRRMGSVPVAPGLSAMNQLKQELTSATDVAAPAAKEPPKPRQAPSKKLERLHFKTSRSLDFLSRKELVAQTGHQVAEWPLVCLKELVDNALDACEEADIPPRIAVTVCDTGLTVQDNGPGIPASVVDSVLDFDVRISSREAYVSPCRGAQGNALKTVVAMPFSLCGHGAVIIESQGIRHEIRVSVDRLRQVPKIDHQTRASTVVTGTKVFVQWPDLARSNDDTQDERFLQNVKTETLSPSLILERSKHRFLQIAEDYCWVNPHLTLSVEWDRDGFSIDASNPTWKKWLPSKPTDPHWYGVEELERLIAANICHRDRLVREFVAEFHGLTGTAKQK